MHPLFRSKTSFLAYLFAWIPIGTMMTEVLAIGGHLRWMESLMVVGPAIFVFLWLCLSPWYTSKNLPLKTTPPWKLIVNHVIAGMCAAAIVLGCVRLILLAYGSFIPDIGTRVRPAFPILGNMLLLLYLLAVALHYVVLAVESSKQSEILSREAELKALKAQINPHFLFNSLNSISALTTLDAAKAREMCIRLAEFLRTSLRLGERTSIPFGEEMDLTRAYLDVEQVRFGSRLRVKQQTEPDCAQVEVPPLLVQPLVENSIKHGIATLPDGGEVTLLVRRSQDRLKVVVENPFDPDAPTPRRSGIGLANVRNRLQTRYGAAARMDVEVNRNHYRVTLTLPCNPRESSIQQ
jgi:two-component system sensor histidine kinase AlgZ